MIKGLAEKLAILIALSVIIALIVGLIKFMPKCELGTKSVMIGNSILIGGCK